MIGLIAFVALYVWVALALSAVFRKSGEEAWKGWVPVLNLVVLLQLGGLSGWLLLLALVPGLGSLAVWVVVIIACHRIGAAFGYGPGMTVLAALLLPVWATVIGFGASRWVGADSQRGAAADPGPVDGRGSRFLPAAGDRMPTPPSPPPPASRPRRLARPPQRPIRRGRARPRRLRRPAAAAASALAAVPPMPAVPARCRTRSRPVGRAWVCARPRSSPAR